jgi:hypothetical protein
MRHAEAELQLWLANDRIERRQREAEMAGLLPGGASPARSIRRIAGESLIGAGRRILPQERQASRAY